MNNFAKLIGSVAVGALALAAAPAFASGATAGSTIKNDVSVSYQVGGVNQTAATASNSIIVDRKVIISATSAPATTSVVPGQTAAVEAFTVTNSSNDVIDIGLSLAQQANGGAAQHGGTDAFDTTNVKYYVMPGNAAVFNAATAIQVTYLDEVAADATINLFVVSDIPLTATNGQVSGNILTATAQAGGTAGTQGAVLTATSGANTAGVDTVLADLKGATDNNYDGTYTVKGDYTVSAPVLTVSKLSTVISDPVNGTTNPKAIPGAVIEYCIVVSNGVGAATATGIGVSDPVPAATTYDSTYGIFLNGTVTSGVCNANGTSGGTYTAGTKTVSGSLADLAAGGSETLRFRVTIPN